jgi:glycosyltransferase involved in cell wall biosynthesis
MPILVTSCRNLNRGAFGGVRRVRALLDAVGPDLMLCQPCEAVPDITSIPYPVDLGRRKILINWGIFNLLWPRNRKILLEATQAHPPAAIVTTSLWDGLALFDRCKAPVFYDAQNVEAIAIEERFGRKHPFASLVRRYEQRSLFRSTHVFACSAVDRDLFIRRYGLNPDRITVVPNGTDIRQFEHAAPPLADDDPLRPTAPGARLLFFMGKLDYQPNAEALRLLATVILPELERRAPGRFRLAVCGGPAPATSPHPSMTFAGYVPTERLHALMGAAFACVSPIQSGSGTRLKIIEYMAAGKPVVSTPKGAEGIECGDGTDLILAEPARFAEAILTLDAAPDKAAAIGQSARRCIAARYDWDTCIKPLWRKRIVESSRPTKYAQS